MAKGNFLGGIAKGLEGSFSWLTCIRFYSEYMDDLDDRSHLPLGRETGPDEELTATSRRVTGEG